jgi:hypothetical protein
MTTSMWDRTNDMARRHDAGGSLWLKLANDRDSAVVVFLGEPYPREVVFVDGRYAPFTDELGAQGYKPSLRVSFNVALVDTKEVKVLEQGVVFFKQVMQLRAKRSLDEWAFEIERHGAAKDVRTTYAVLPERQLTAKEQAEFKALPLHDLERLYASDSGGGGGNGLGSYDRGSSGAIDPKDASALSQALKTLPRDVTDRFCAKFEVARIRDLPAAQLDKARAFVEAAQAAARPDDNYADPFAE